MYSQTGQLQTVEMEVSPPSRPPSAFRNITIEAKVMREPIKIGKLQRLKFYGVNLLLP